MEKDALVEVLREAGASRAKDGWFRFESRQGVTLLVSAAESLVTVDRVIRMAVRSTFVVAESERGERYFLDPQRIAVVRQTVAGAEGSGFLSVP